jgi:hypothetical protein
MIQVKGTWEETQGRVEARPSGERSSLRVYSAARGAVRRVLESQPTARGSRNPHSVWSAGAAPRDRMSTALLCASPFRWNC